MTTTNAAPRGGPAPLARATATELDVAADGIGGRLKDTATALGRMARLTSHANTPAPASRAARAGEVA